MDAPTKTIPNNIGSNPHASERMRWKIPNKALLSSAELLLGRRGGAGRRGCAVSC